MTLTNHLQARLDPHGLSILGQFYEGERRIILVGNAGPAFWPVFSTSVEFRDGQADPLDRWSKRIGDTMAAQTGAVVYPFDGPPFPPFIAWALKSREVNRSAMSILIHHQYGLWHAYRFALLVARARQDRPPTAATPSPCESCADKPCLTRCPVNAITVGNFDAKACLDYLQSTPDSDCCTLGCAARRACPVGQKYRYAPAQARFHTKAYIASRPKIQQ